MTPPNRIGRYEIQQSLGGGGMATVYRAFDTMIGRPVAIKILRVQESDGDAKEHERFLQEARIAGNLHHENVIRTYDFGVDDSGNPYLVLEFLEGEDLGKAIRAGRTGDLNNRLRIASELAAALEYIHPRKVIHRDLKPENVFLLSNGSVKLVDFGIARTTEVSNLTQAGMAIGTLPYMSPEQLRGETPTHLVDVYAYGLVLFEMFTGSKAIQSETQQQAFYAILHQPLDAAKLRAAALPEPLSKLITACAAKEKEQRPKDFTAIRAELARISSGGAPVDAAPTKLQPAAPPKKSWMPAAAAAGVAALLLIGYLAMRGGKTSDKSPAPSGRAEATPQGMVKIPGGPFLFGKNKQRVVLPAFYIDRTEVTNAAWAKYSKATGTPLPPGFAAARPDLPVVNVTFAEAEKYAAWAGKRLPGSRQWERAARGEDGRPYPWGNDADPKRAMVGAGRKGRLAPAVSFPAGASPSGILQMVGNAWELVDEPVTPPADAVARFAGILTPPPDSKERWVLIRGGSYAEPLDPDVMWSWVEVPARYRSELVGFRCVKPVTGE